jgi:hypothetical protein
VKRLAFAVAACLPYLLLAYGNIVFGRETLVATGNFHPFDDRIDRSPSHGRRGYPYWNWHDQGASWWQWDPAGEFFKRAYRKGTLPLWDSTIAGGVDAHVNVTQGQYFPPYAAVLLSGNTPEARDAYYLGLLLFAGISVVLLCQRHALHPLAGAAAAVSFMLGGAMTLNVNSIVGQSIALSFELVPLVRQPRSSRSPVWTDVPPYVRRLQRDDSRFRIHGVHLFTLTPNVNQGLGLDGIGSRHAFNSHRYAALLRRYFRTEATVYPVATDLLPARRVILDLLNVRYLIVYDPTPHDLRTWAVKGLQATFGDDRFVILRNARAWGRAYVAKRIRVVHGIDAALDAVGDLSAPGEVVLEEPPALAFSAGEETVAECKIREYLPERVSIEAVSAAPAVLVLSDTHLEGWTATVNGRPARILHANVAFRGVEIPAGRFTVEFRYVTPGLRAGLAVSAAALAVIAGVIGWPRIRRA